MPGADPKPKVFISYSHDSDAHRDRVHGLAASLCRDGIDCRLDLLLPESPPDQWPLWMEKRLEEADRVLIICTETYKRRARGEEEPDKGHGVGWEARIIYTLLYRAKLETTKFLPVIFRPEDKPHILLPLAGGSHYLLDGPSDADGYEKLYRVLTGQPLHVAPPVGEPIKLPSSPADPKSMFPRPGGKPPKSAPAPASKSSLPRHNLPPRDKNFAGRKAELKTLHGLLGKKAKVGVAQQAALHAHGGVGKTALAIEYAWENLARYPGGAFFLLCETALPVSAMASVAEELGVELEKDPEGSARAAKLALESGGRALLILDNIAGGPRWQAWLDSGLLPAGDCRVLVTTRAESLPQVAMEALDRLTTDDGAALLDSFKPAKGAERDAALAIVGRLEGWAVALVAAGTYMKLNPALTWAALEKSFRDGGLKAVRNAHASAKERINYGDDVDGVMEALLESLPAAELRAAEFAALLPSDMAPRPWLESLLSQDATLDFSEPAPGYETRPSAAPIDHLVKLRLLRPDREDERLLSLHRVLSEILAERLDADESHRTALLDAIAVFGEARANACKEAVIQPELRWELTPLVELSGALREHGRIVKAAKVANWTKWGLNGLARYLEAKEMLEPLSDDPALARGSPKEYASANDNLATILQALGELPEARRRIEQAIAIDEKRVPKDHPTLAISYSNLAIILSQLGELPEARLRIEQAIAINEQHLPKDHPTLAICYSNLATILKNLGESPGARRRIEQAIAILEMHLPKDHPTLATSYSNLAMILMDLGELPEARRRIEQALAIEEKHLPKDHPTLAISRLNYGDILKAARDLAAAADQWRHADAIARKHFPEAHPLRQAIASRLKSLGRP